MDFLIFKAVFISNKAFFQRYSDANLFGLTGTLGSTNSMSFLADLYGVHFVNIPTSRDKNFYMLNGLVAFDQADWLDHIAATTTKEAKQRPVLIIAENIEMSQLIERQLLSAGVSPSTLIKYGRDGDSVEERFQQKPAQAGDIILATNKGGRGTDITVNTDVNEREHGLHVLLTFLPENVRIEEQAFGRTSRNGAPGTGQFVIQVDRSQYESQYDLSQCSPSCIRTRLLVLGDAIIEREKIARDNKESARLCQLKHKNILHLELEEDLFTAFSVFKRDVVSTKIKKIMNNSNYELRPKVEGARDLLQNAINEVTVPIKAIMNNPKVKFVDEISDLFQKIIMDRWAFWLDEAAEKIKQVTTKFDQQVVRDLFKSDFIEKQQTVLNNCSIFENLVTDLTQMPEEAIHLGKVCLKYKNWDLAKYCFEQAKLLGDITGFANIGSAFCLCAKKNQDKKEIRRELKKAINKLESLKQSLLGNYKMADFLSQSDKRNQTISHKENLYQEQVKGKLEVIGLQLNYLQRATGGTLEPSDFVIEKPQDVDASDLAKAERIYKCLVGEGLIQKEMLTKSYCDSYSKIIQDNLDPSVSQPLIEMLKGKTEYDLSDVEQLACSSAELWEALNFAPDSVTECYTIDLSKVKKELTDAQMEVWETIENKIPSPMDVDISIFDTSKQLEELKKHLIKKKILTKTRRVKVELVQFDENFAFTGDYLKYARIEYQQTGAGDSKNKRGIIEFLTEMKDHIVKNGGEYLYESSLPYGTREEEGKKLWMFLKEKRIVKSGGLKDLKYRNMKKKITEKVNKIVKNNNDLENDKDFIIARFFVVFFQIYYT